MKVITALAVAATLLLNALGPHSSVGGPIASLFVSLLVMWVIGAYLAWSKSFGLVGWLLNMVVAIVGGFATLMLFNTVMETVTTLTHFQGRMIDSQWSYAVEVGMTLFAVIGSWAPIEIGSRLFAQRTTSTQ